MNNSVSIYTLSDPETNTIRYVGKANNLRKRLKGHCRDMSETHKTHWIRNLQSRGLNPIIEEVENLGQCAVSEWQEAERFWIESFRQMGFPLTNSDAGGGGLSFHTRETRLKIGHGNKGRKPSALCMERANQAKRTPEARLRNSLAQLGKKRSPEVRAILSKAFKGRKISPEAIAKTAASNTGKKRTPEQRARMAAARVGIKFSEEGRNNMSIAQKNRIRNPENWAKMREAVAKYKYTEAHRAKISANTKAKWASGCFDARVEKQRKNLK